MHEHQTRPPWRNWNAWASWHGGGHPHDPGASAAGRLEPDELVSKLVDAEWDDRQARKLSRLLKAARFRYRAGLEDIDFGLKRTSPRHPFLRLADCRWIEEHQRPHHHRSLRRR